MRAEHGRVAKPKPLHCKKKVIDFPSAAGMSLTFLYSVVASYTRFYPLFKRNTFVLFDVKTLWSLSSRLRLPDKITSGTGPALQTAVNSVLFITVKMSSFYLLWTYLTHNLFQVWLSQPEGCLYIVFQLNRQFIVRNLFDYVCIRVFSELCKN
jgi:hypothetical protein